MTAAVRFPKKKILALPHPMTFTELAGCLGVSEPTVRRMQARGELADVGIVVHRVGQQWRVQTESVLRYLGLADSASLVQTHPKRAVKARPASPAVTSVPRRRTP